MFKWTYGLSGNDYRVAALSKFYPRTVKGLTKQDLKSIGHFSLSKLPIESIS